MLVLDKEHKFKLLQSIQDIRDYFIPIENEKQAVAFVLIDKENIDPDSVYVKKVEDEYHIKILEIPSGCHCGVVHYLEYYYTVSVEGKIQTKSMKEIKTEYHSDCMG